MKSFIELLKDVHSYVLSHGTKIPFSTGDGVFSLPLELNYEPTLEWSLRDCNDLLKSIKSLYAYLQNSEDRDRLHKEASFFTIAMQARNGNGSVPEHSHTNCCEEIVVLLQADENGKPYMPDTSPIYYIGIGCESTSHSWPENALLALSIKGSSFQQVKEFAHEDALIDIISSKLEKLAQEE